MTCQSVICCLEARQSRTDEALICNLSLKSTLLVQVAVKDCSGAIAPIEQPAASLHSRQG